jgi:hypothetical protein
MCKFSKKFLKNHKKMDKKRKFLLKTYFKYFKNNLFLKKSDSMFSPHNTSQFIIKNTNGDCEIENGNFDYENLFFLNNLNSSNEIFIDSKNGDDNCNLSTDNSSIISESLKERAFSLIKDENINEKEITAYSQDDLMTFPNLDEDVVTVTTSLLEIDSFEIFSKQNINPVFARNLLNIIHIINFIWLASKNKIEIFHRILLKL